MKALIILPFVGLLLFPFVTELLTVAHSSQEKAVNFADDMNAAIDCATRGIPIAECSPDLMSYDFTPEMDETIEISNDILAFLEEYKDYNVSVDEEGQTVIILG